MEKLSIDPTCVDLREMIERGTLLHGHLGPYLVAGIRMGLLALRELHSPGYFGVRVEAEAGQTTPLSCLLDGIQIGSGCTVGKGNLRIVGDGRACARFVGDAGREVTIMLKPEVERSFRGSDPQEKARELEALAEEELFAWTTSSP